jgi:hypothetical protein
MLAASRLGSNVPPYNLQTTPVLALTGITANEFKNNPAIAVLKTYPGQFSQQHATRQQCGRYPIIVAVQNHGLSARFDPNRFARIETLLKASQLKSPDSNPDKTSHGPEHDINGENQHQRQPGGNEQATRGRNDNS